MKNILVIRFSSLGDIILTTGVLKYLSQTFPNIKINILTLTRFADIFDGLYFIDKVYAIEKTGGIRDLIKYAKNMPSFDFIFDLHNNLRSNIIKHFIKGKVYTYNKNSFLRRLYVKFRIGGSKLQAHTVQKYFKPFGKVFHLDTPSIEELRPYLTVSSPKTLDRPNIVIHPFASKITKEWCYFYELCSIFISSGYHVQVIGVGEIELPLDAVKKTGFIPLSELKNIIAGADVFITTDSGPLHIAAALNTKTVAIFGPTTKELGFYPSFNNITVIENNNLLCRPCHIHGSDSCPKKHFQCMKAISAELVAETTLKILNK